MKINLVNNNKTYSIYYRAINENEPIGVIGLRLLFLTSIQKHENNIKLTMQEINNSEKTNIEVYDIKVSQ